MRLSQYPINTAKETPAEAEVLEPSADAARGADPARGGGPLQLAAYGPEDPAKSRDHRPRGNGPGRRARGLMPVFQPGELWQESGRWTAYGRSCCASRTGTTAISSPAPPTRKSSPTSSAATSRATAAAAEFLPGADEVPRRDPAAFRRHARARVHHEGCLLLPRGCQPRSSRFTAPCTTPTPASSPAWDSISARCGPIPARSEAMSRRSSTCSPPPARTRSSSPTRTTMPPTSSWPRRCRRRSRVAAPREAMAKVPTPARAPLTSSRACSRWSRPGA